MRTETGRPDRTLAIIWERDDGSWGGPRGARMEGIEKWLDLGSFLKVELTAFGNKIDVWCEKRNSRARLRFQLRNGRMEKAKTARGSWLECTRGEGLDLVLNK